MSALFCWLLTKKNAGLPKFVLTPSAFLPRHLAVARDALCGMHSDSWDGFPRSQHSILRFACEKEVKGLVFLSGDEHVSSFTKGIVTNTRTNKTCVFYSIHSSALYAPYPFANAKRDDFPETDQFCFNATRYDFPERINGLITGLDKDPYCCDVQAEFADEGDGFAIVNMRPQPPDWELQVTFYSAEGPKCLRGRKLRSGCEGSAGITVVTTIPVLRVLREE